MMIWKAVIALLALSLMSGCNRDRSALHELRNLEQVVERNPANTNALQKLVGYSRDRSSITRGNAVAILGHLGQQDTTWVRQHIVPVLTEALKDKDQGVRRTAASSLEWLRPNDYASALPALISALDEGEVDVAWFSAKAIGRLGSSAEPAVPALTKALEVSSPGSPDNAPQLRKYAAEALGAVGPSAHKSIPALTKALGDPNPHFRVQAVIALARIDQTSSSHLTTLGELLRNQEVGVRRKAIEVFVEIPPTNAAILAAITNCLSDPDDYVRKSAETILHAKAGRN